MGVASTPLRLKDVEKQVCEMEVDGGTPDLFAGFVASSVAPQSDLHASADYRRHLLGELAKRAMRTALAS
jgi:carbon-monoxide dehydrogenase medium subunit